MQTTPILHIIPFLSGQAFQPERIEAMGIAYENVCKSLKLIFYSTNIQAIECA
jgi:hypothetical protein